MNQALPQHASADRGSLKKVARVAQTATLLAMALIVFHLVTTILIPFSWWDLSNFHRYAVLHSLIGDGVDKTMEEALALDAWRLQIGIAIVVFPYLLLMAALFPLWRFFARCASQDAFNATAQKWLRTSALCFIAYSLIKPFQTTVMWMTETAGTAAFANATPILISDGHLLTLFLSIALLGIASVITEATKVAQENREFV